MEKILIVEDEPQLLKALEIRLKNEGYAIITASDGWSAFNKAKQEKPDIIILDIILPKIGGYSVCKGVINLITRRYQNV